VLKSTEQDVTATVLITVGGEWEGKGGRYLEDCEEAERAVDDGEVFGVGCVR
jgi:hypothetical protein